MLNDDGVHGGDGVVLGDRGDRVGHAFHGDFPGAAGRHLK